MNENTTPNIDWTGAKPKPPELPRQNQVRWFLRIVGLLILFVGFLCFVVALISFFAASGGSGFPRLFWLAFIGLPLMFIGSVMCMYGFMGLAFRFFTGETLPVTVDAANYTAEATQGAVKTVAKAAAEGMVEGVESAQSQQLSKGKD